MSSTTTERIVWGEAYRDDYSATATSPSVAPDFATTSVTLVWDQLLPAGSTGTPLRVDYRWRPDGTSDSQFSFSAGVLAFDLLAPDVVADLRPGNWRVYWCVGEPAEQDVIGPWTVFVEGPPAGALPTVDPT